MNSYRRQCRFIITLINVISNFKFCISRYLHNSHKSTRIPNKRIASTAKPMNSVEDV